MPCEHLFSRIGPEVWYARREGGSIVELRIDAAERTVRAGNLLKLRVERSVPGLQAAFLELADTPNAYLHNDDLPLGPDESERRPIEHRLSPGSELVVRIEREPVATKGPKVSGRVSLPGRWLVYLPTESRSRVSRRIQDPEVRERLLALVGEVAGSGGFVVRTAAATAQPAEVQRDGARLVGAWADLVARGERGAAPQLLHVEPDLPARMLRDATLGPDDRIWFDCRSDLDEVRAWALDVDSELSRRLAWHPGPGSLWDDADLQSTLERLMRPRVWLRSGGFLVIEETEALVSVDVNTGRNVGRRDAEATVLRTNLEAADELARQLRLRDLGGVIVVDFIDMVDDASRDQVRDALCRALSADSERTSVGRFSELGLLELTRRRNRAHPRQLLTDSSHSWECQGRRPAPRWVAFRIFLEWDRSARAGRTVERVRAHPDTLAWLRRRRDEGGVSSVDLSRADLVAEEDWPGWRYRVESR